MYHNVQINRNDALVNTADLAIIASTLIYEPQMKHVAIFCSCIVLLAGCAHLEVPTKVVYPFRAEFVAQGNIQGRDTTVNGAIYLSSGETGTIQTYLPNGMASNSIDIQADKLVIKDMWGRQLDTITLPVSGVAGMVAGDMPSQKYLYKQKIPGGSKIIYTWGTLCINDAVLPTKIHVQGKAALDIFFKPAGRNVTMEVIYGTDAVKILFMVKQGGRWVSS